MTHFGEEWTLAHGFDSCGCFTIISCDIAIRQCIGKMLPMTSAGIDKRTKEPKWSTRFVSFLLFKLRSSIKGGQRMFGFIIALSCCFSALKTWHVDVREIKQTTSASQFWMSRWTHLKHRLVEKYSCLCDFGFNDTGIVNHRDVYEQLWSSKVAWFIIAHSSIFTSTNSISTITDWHFSSHWYRLRHKLCCPTCRNQINLRIIV